MWKVQFVSVVLSCLIPSLFAQEANHYRVDENQNVEALNFTLTAASGSCIIKPSSSKHPVNIFGNPENEKVTPSFKTWMEEDIQQVSFVLQQNEPGIGKKLSYSVFNDGAELDENNWHVYIADELPITLNLNYGIGKADVDLSGLAINKIKINTGSADVNLGYPSGKMNKVEMDTFMVTVDMGTLKVDKVNHSRAKNTKSHIYASVGAGSLEVKIPDEDIPIVVYINDSPLCRISLCKSFKEIKPNVFANESYSVNAPDLLTFELDVAMGKISFVTK
jgi:hypothetical protein